MTASRPSLGPVSVAVGLSFCCAVARPPPPPPVPREIHVDATALEALSDGTAARPYKSPERAIAVAQAGDAIRLHDGIYGPFRVDRAVRIAGGRAAVVSGPADAVVIDLAAPGAALERVIVQGGRVGVRAAAAATLLGLAFSAQRQAALRVEAGEVAAAQLALVASFPLPDLVGVDVVGGSAALADLRIEGPFRFGVRIGAARATLDRVRVTDAQVGVAFLSGAVAEARDLDVGPVRGAAVLVSAATVTLRDSLFSRCEMAVTVLPGSTLTGEELTVAGCDRAGVAAAESTVRLVRHVHVGPVSHAAVASEGAAVTLVEPVVIDPGFAALSIHRGAFRVEGGVLSGARTDPDGDFGDAVFASGPEPLEMRHTACQRNDGVAADVHGGETRLIGVEATRSGLGAVGAGRGARVDVVGGVLVGSRGVGVAATAGALVSVRDSRVVGHGEAQVFAACASGARITVERSRLVGAQPPSPCVVVSGTPR